MNPGENSAVPDPDVGLDVPVVDTERLPPPEEQESLVEPGIPLLQRLSGAWEQVEPLAANDPDFAPGGYSRSVLAIRGGSGELFVYRGFGRPNGPVAAFVSGQFSVNFGEDGFVTIAPSKVRPTAFFSQPRMVPVADGSSVTMSPPASDRVSTTWAREPGSGDPLLRIGSKRYRRAPADVYDAIVHGQPGAVDQALDRQIAAAEQASSAPAQAAGVPAPAPQPASNVDFFGTKIRGRYVAFVIDNSGSMSVGGKLPAAIAELRRAISSLPADTNVYVVFFNSGAFELRGFQGWIKLAPSARQGLLDALQGVGSDGGTNPEPALRLAFGLGIRPDEVFLMTDGLMEGNVAAVIAQLNSQSRARTRVHTYAFGQDADRFTLSAIAAANDGQFREIP